jgi:hypothetical protein
MQSVPYLQRHMLAQVEVLPGMLITAYQTTRHDQEYYSVKFYGRENLKFPSGPSLFTMIIKYAVTDSTTDVK